MTQVEITDADREAAAMLYLELEEPPYSPRDLAEADAHRRGDYDSHASIQAFARYRIAADRAGYERGVRESAEVAGRHSWQDGKLTENTCCAATGCDISASILALIPTTGGEDA